jgi:hypothetical protein
MTRATSGPRRCADISYMRASPNLSWLWLADFDAAVVGIAAQPMLWEGSDDGVRRARYPDFLCVRRDRSAHVVDVKAPSALEEPKVAASLNWTRGVCEARGWTYEVWTGVDPVVLRNTRFIAAGRRPDLADPDVLRAVAECAGRSEVKRLDSRGAGRGLRGCRSASTREMYAVVRALRQVRPR